MCLVAVGVDSHPRYPLVVAGNRDELHARPSAAADWWPDAPDICGGRDLQAMGSWLAVDRQARFAVVTNQPAKAAPNAQAPSRGHLVSNYLRAAVSAGDFLTALAERATNYAGFCLVLGQANRVQRLCEPSPGQQALHRLTGISAISNAAPMEDWPKAAYLSAGMRQVLDAEEPSADALFNLLAERERVAAGGPHRFSATPFLVDAEYGTRASTLLMLASDGEATLLERRFNAQGQLTGESELSFQTSPPPTA